MINNSKVVGLTPEIAMNAGLLHADMKKKIRNFGLADSIILATARKLRAKVVTGDSHFKGFKETVFLE